MAARPMMAKGINFCLSISNLFSSIMITSQKVSSNRFARRGMVSLPRQAE